MRSLIAITCLLTGFAVKGQFYPASSATWCLVDQDTWEARHVNMVMDDDPDTMIMGQTYQRIREYRGVYGVTSFELWDRHYVRSTEDGKGYVFLLDSMAEYLTGDTAAIAGDTIHNVLAWNQLSECNQPDQSQPHALYTAIVDSVVTLTNAGVTIRRHYAHTPCYLASPSFNRRRFFWQAGMGTSAGPYVQLRSGFVPIEMECAMAHDVPVFGLDADQESGHTGLPGGGTCCWPINIVDAVAERSPVARTSAWPNPSTGIFQVGTDKNLTCEVRDALGRHLLYATGGLIDLSGQPEGVYLARATGGRSRWVLRLVVQR